MSGNVPALPAVSGALEALRAEGAAPALAAAVHARGALVHASWHGELDAPFARPLRRDDLFDVASLTKVLATGTLAAQLVAEGVLDLDGLAAATLPGFERAGKERITIRQLLAHSSGLPAWRPLYEAVAGDAQASALFLPPGERPPFGALSDRFAHGQALVKDAVFATALEAAPGARAVYSDLGFLALGWIAEALSAEPLSRLVEERVLRPLGLSSTFFVDGLDPVRARGHADGRAFVPTGWCEHRHEIVAGAPHDDNSWAAGGAAGHAGVFSTATEVAALGQAWLEALQGRPSIVPPGVARAFATRDPTPGSSRALAWDTPSGDAPSIGSRLGRGPRGAIGHLGYTGCSLWIDLDAEIVCALLTNHVHPSGVAEKARIRAARRRFHDAVAEALGI